MHGTITELASFPIKGLSAQFHDSVKLAKHGGFPGDRMFGFAKANSGFDAANPEPLPKDCFLVLMQFEQLAGLQTAFDADSWTLDVTHNGSKTSFDMRDPTQRQSACDDLTNLLALSAEQEPFFAHAHPHRFTDVSVHSEQFMNCVSLINTASVDALSEKTELDISPARFRGNIVIQGWPAFSELDLVGREVLLGDMRFKVLKRTQRCPATEVNPITAERDINVPYLIRKNYGHFDMGIYLETLTDGDIKVGDTAEVVS